MTRINPWDDPEQRDCIMRGIKMSAKKRMRQRQPREQDEKHRRFVASLSCMICGGTDVQACHVRYADLTVGKPFTGGATKPDDKFTVPLCVKHHSAQHNWNERDWWKLAGIDPIKIALALYSVSGDQERGEIIVNSCRGYELPNDCSCYVPSQS